MALKIILAVLCITLSATGQQTIFNVPSTDVLDRGKVYTELDVSFKINGQTAFRRFSSLVPRFVAGVGKNVEVGLNFTGNIQPGNDSSTLVPSVKWKFFQKAKFGVALVTGTNFYVPVRTGTYRFGTYSYFAGSNTVGKTRVTAGAYAASKSVFAPNAVRAGGQFGIEQTLNNRFVLAADWITGRHTSGYFTPGIVFSPNSKTTTYFSYSIGNSRAWQGNHFFLFEIGYKLN